MRQESASNVGEACNIFYYASTPSKRAASTVSKPKTTTTTTWLNSLAAGESHSLYTAAAKPTSSSSFYQLSFSPAFKSAGVKGGEGPSNVILYSHGSMFGRGVLFFQ